MDVSPYEKLCQSILGGLPDNQRGRPLGKTTSELARRLGLTPNTLFRWPLVDGTRIRIIPERRANLIELLSNGAVTAEEIREFAKRYKSGKANRGRLWSV